MLDVTFSFPLNTQILPNISLLSRLQCILHFLFSGLLSHIAYSYVHIHVHVAYHFVKLEPLHPLSGSFSRKCSDKCLIQLYLHFFFQWYQQRGSDLGNTSLTNRLEYDPRPQRLYHKVTPTLKNYNFKFGAILILLWMWYCLCQVDPWDSRYQFPFWNWN